jgi:S-adenosyl-L-methionine hydrolase (adenosine-forming)
MKSPVITLLTDFGTSCHYAGAMKGVMLGICPGAQLVDISHEIRPYAIPEAAFTLAQAWECFPAGTVHLIVVDPGVGSERRPILLEAGGHRFVAPDNGVLTMLFEAAPRPRVREITASRYFRKPVSQTFHGRDIFAPGAAHLAKGLSPARFGKPIKDYQRLSFSKPVSTAPDRWSGFVLAVDRFGNVITNFDAESWPRLATGKFEMKVGKKIVSRLSSSYADVELGNLFIIAGSGGFLEISLNQGNAADALGIQPGGFVELRLW